MASTANLSRQEVVLVTGASSGVGRAIARAATGSGRRVFGTSRDPSRLEALPNVEMLRLDVRDSASVEACVNAVTDRCGRLDVLVNNAGYELAGALEEVSLEEARAQFDTNFFGIVRMVNAFLPTLRAQKQGLILNVSSLAAVAATPFMGMYSASKCAVEGYSEALRHELAPLGIAVCVVEPGFLKTAMMENRQVAARRIDAYEPWRQRALHAIRAHEQKAPGPEIVARTVLDIMGMRTPPLRHFVGRQATLVAGMRRFLPQRVFEKGARSTFSLD